MVLENRVAPCHALKAESLPHGLYEYYEVFECDGILSTVVRPVKLTLLDPVKRQIFTRPDGKWIYVSLGPVETYHMQLPSSRCANAGVTFTGFFNISDYDEERIKVYNPFKNSVFSK